MKPTVIKCECGRVSNPIQLSIVKNAWIDSKGISYFEFDCPQCCKTNVVKTDEPKK